VILTSDMTVVAAAPARRGDRLLAASLDVEWTKNYRIANGNVPFCWSVVWLAVPAGGAISLPTEFAFTSAYVVGTSETQDLVDAADAQLACVLRHADVIIGHQVSSDLAVLRNVSSNPLVSVEALRARWHGRRAKPAKPAVVDTRYDADSLLSGASRRLVDVCTELELDVTQPELAGTSMTALHRKWLETGDASARERISVLNLRHSLSAAYVALYSLGLGRRSGPVNVNQVLERQLDGRFGWLASPAFCRLV
jgi:hypothetical protein